MNIITSRIDYRVGDEIHQARLAYDDSDSTREFKKVSMRYFTEKDE